MNRGAAIERAELLATASRVLLSRMPTWQARFSAHGNAYRARFEWPGTVSVADDNTGEVLARSEPGQPSAPYLQTRALPALPR